MLRKTRIALAAIFFLAITAMFLDSTGTLQKYFGFTAKMQLLPAVLALNVAVIVGVALLTLIFGRVYCSVICPLGVLQDIISNISGRRKKKGMRFSYSKEVKWLRYGVWVVFVAALIAGVQAFVVLLAPYSAYGRMIESIKHPFMPVWIVAAVTFVVVAVLSWMNGRTWCNTICPVGTTLSFLSRFSLLRPTIDTDKCRSCKVCEKKCKASCIDISSHRIDYSRCVDCFDCIGNCKFDAMHYRPAWGTAKKESPAPAQKGTKASSAPANAENPGRRAFIAGSAMALGAIALKAQDKKLDGGLAPIIDKARPERETLLTPFGSRSVKDFYSRCTACQLCVSQCPNNVLRPSTSLERFMQPEMSYENGYCRPECTLCSQVCPAGAILPITPEQKTSFHIGVASVDRTLCVVEAEGVSCGNCARHCPVGAIEMVRQYPDQDDSPLIPSVNEAMCIGCGACENLCPARPLSAIRVNGLSVHIKD